MYVGAIPLFAIVTHLWPWKKGFPQIKVRQLREEHHRRRDGTAHPGGAKVCGGTAQRTRFSESGGAGAGCGGSMDPWMAVSFWCRWSWCGWCEVQNKSRLNSCMIIYWIYCATLFSVKMTHTHRAAGRQFFGRDALATSIIVSDGSLCLVVSSPFLRSTKCLIGPDRHGFVMFFPRKTYQLVELSWARWPRTVLNWLVQTVPLKCHKANYFSCVSFWQPWRHETRTIYTDLKAAVDDILSKKSPKPMFHQPSVAWSCNLGRVALSPIGMPSLWSKEWLTCFAISKASVMNLFKQFSLNLSICCGFEHVDTQVFFFLPLPFARLRSITIINPPKVIPTYFNKVWHAIFPQRVSSSCQIQGVLPIWHLRSLSGCRHWGRIQPGVLWAAGPSNKRSTETWRRVSPTLSAPHFSIGLEQPHGPTKGT